MENKYRVDIVDDEQLFRAGLANLINGSGNAVIGLEAGNGKEYLQQLQNSAELPHVILLDLEMPIMDGIELTKVLQKEYPEIKIVILSSHYTPLFIINLVELGASSYMKKNENITEVMRTIKNVIQNGFHYSDHVVRLIREYMKHGKTKREIGTEKSLTDREKEVLKLLCEELSNKEIADRIFLSPRTVEGHRKNLLSKTGAKNTAGLVIYAIENGYYRLEKNTGFMPFS